MMKLALTGLVPLQFLEFRTNLKILYRIHICRGVELAKLAACQEASKWPKYTCQKKILDLSPTLTVLKLYIYLVYGLDTTKSVFGVFDKVRLKPVSYLEN